MEECTLDSALLIIGAGIEQVYAYKLARKMGYKVIGTDGNPHAPAFTFADYKLLASTRNHIDTLNAVKNLHHYKSIRGVVTIANDVPYTVAYVANYLGLPSISLETASLSIDKLKMKNSFKRKMLGPQFKECTSLDALISFVKMQGSMHYQTNDGRGSRESCFN